MAVFFSSAKQTQGFTLLELMVTLSIATILMGIGVPSFQNLISGNRVVAEFNGLQGHIAYLRSEAISRKAPVVLCPTTNETSCSGSDWDRGWLAFVDDGSGGGGESNRTVDGSETILRVVQPSPGSIDIRTVGFVNANSVMFYSDGKIENGEADDIGVFIMCDDNGPSSARGLAFSAFGQLRKMMDTDSSGVIDYELTAGGAISTNEVTCP